MIAFAEYLLKVVLCSAIFTGYYWIALRNKLFHEWNRFYLLTAVLVSLTLPLVKITVFNSKEQKSEPVYEVIKTITTDEKWFEPAKDIAPSATQSFLTAETISITLYLLISFIALLTLLINVFKISRLYRQYNKWKIQNIVFVDTNAKGTPFSFLNYIFWNSSIDLHSTHGQQIFAHEMVHVKQKHSWDKLLMSIVMIVFWSNPFFWLIKKELSMIHEFIADRKSLKDGDTAAFAAMILAAAFPGHTMPLTNPFFYSPVKRRLLMITKLNNPKVGYISRLLLLPLLIVLFVAFAVKTKNNQSVTNFTKPFTVVIDAGHGYRNNVSRDGAKGINDITEDDLCLSIAKKFAQLNKDENLKLVFTRTDKNFIDLKERIKIIKENKADLFISIHANTAPKIKQGNSYIENPLNGFELYTPTSEHLLFNESVSLGSAIINEMKNIMMIREPGIKQRKAGVYILTASPCPAVLLECGFISNTKDAAFLNDEKNQEKIAEAVLKAIEKYALADEKEELSMNKLNVVSVDTTPFTGEKFELHDKNRHLTVKADSIIVKQASQGQAFDKGIFVLNGGVIAIDKMKNKILTAGKLTVYPPNDTEMIRKYGPEAKDGVIIIEDGGMKNEAINKPKITTLLQDDSPVFTKAEVMPQFPGGEEAWNKHIQELIEGYKDQLMKKGESGSCTLRFIVEKDGSIHEMSASSSSSTPLLIEIASEAIKAPNGYRQFKTDKLYDAGMRKK